MSLAPPWGGPARATVGEHPRRPQSSAPAALSERGLAAIADLIAGAGRSSTRSTCPTSSTSPAAYRDEAAIGRGIGNYLSFGEFPEDDSDQPALLLPRGRIMDHDLSVVDAVDQSGVAETVAHAHYADDGRRRDAPPSVRRANRPRVPGSAGARSRRSRTRPGTAGARRPATSTTRWRLGPLARMSVAYAEGGAAGVAVARFLDRARPGTRGPLQHARPDRRPGDRDARSSSTGSTAGSGELQGEPGQRRPGVRRPLELGSRRWPNEVEGWSLGESPRGARRPLDTDPGSPDPRLPGRRWEHLEHLTAGRPGAARGPRAGAGRHARARFRPAGRDPANRPLVRPVHGMRRPLMEERAR